MISPFPANNLNLTECRDIEECSAAPPVPPVNTNLELMEGDEGSGNALFEHDMQIYQCKDGYTLAGIQHELVSCIRVLSARGRL